MLYITGDMHGERDRFTAKYLPGESLWTKNDTLAVCGDFGFIFTDSAIEGEFLDSLEKKPYTICFVDGNHENFPAIYKYPREKWNGGYIHRIRENVIHLMRGEIYDIDGRSVFTFGGAYSRDKESRIPGLSWWREELPKESEYRNAEVNLRDHGNKADIILTHTAPRSVIRKLGRYPDLNDRDLTGFFDVISKTVDFGQWYFGHWHTDKQVTPKYRALRYNVVPAK